jgi:hypothetical protein
MVSTVFQGLEAAAGTFQDKYFNRIADDLRKYHKGKTLEQVLNWVTTLHGYQFDGKAGMNLILNTPLPPLGLDVQNLLMAFKEGGIACITNLNQDATTFQAADSRQLLLG